MSHEQLGPPPATYEAIMEATYRAFCKHGYANLTMRDIAAEFEKSRSLLHYHYETKQSLIVTLLDYLVEHYIETLETERSGDPRADLESFVAESIVGPDEEAFDFWEFHTALLELRAQAHRVEAYREQLAESYGVVEETLSTIIADGIEQGVFRPVDPERYAATLLDLLDGSRERYITLGEDYNPEGAHENIREYLLGTLYLD